MSGKSFTGPDCGVMGCAREVGHIGDHLRDPAVPAMNRAAVALFLALCIEAGVALGLVVALQVLPR